MRQSGIFAVLFALFTVWCALRATDAWAAGATGWVSVFVLAGLGGVSLTLRNVPRARRSQR